VKDTKVPSTVERRIQSYVAIVKAVALRDHSRNKIK
jgi:hypothetical protein